MGTETAATLIGVPQNAATQIAVLRISATPSVVPQTVVPQTAVLQIVVLQIAAPRNVEIPIAALQIAVILIVVLQIVVPRNVAILIAEILIAATPNVVVLIAVIPVVQTVAVLSARNAVGQRVVVQRGVAPAVVQLAVVQLAAAPLADRSAARACVHRLHYHCGCDAQAVLLAAHLDSVSTKVPDEQLRPLVVLPV